MKYRQIGKSGLISSNLTLGTMIFGEKSGRATSEEDAIKMINYYLDLGGNHIDTANVYADGRSEEIIGKTLKGKRDKTIISTKVRFRTSSDINAEGLSRTHIVQSVDDSLARLKTDYIDLLYLHSFDPITPLEETIRAIEHLIDKGKVRYIGVSNFKAWQLMKAQGLTKYLNTNPFIAAQYQYSLVKRDLEYEFFDLFESEGLGLLTWGPLGGGFLSGKYTKDKPNSGRIASTSDDTEESWERRNSDKNWQIINAIESLTKKYNVTFSQVAIAWILSNKVVSSVILGVRTLDQLKDNMGANNLYLTLDEVNLLNNLSQLPELYPYRFMNEYGNREI
ncbi:aldo/keto reductase [uncultured Algibacter sp.]|uniref:aldo/keto reductase n=1 Tax=uncultured Algibacter sp. TaxID=298659 RepID=UPI0026027C07|nr:aldo/keto reductase [uncultured Algibacter sp.]